MAKKYYAVRKGKVTGIFETWDECKSSVDGYSGAEYKSFPNKEDAEEYLGIGKEKKIADVNKLTAYVDGSFNEGTGTYSFGCVIIKPDGEIVREMGNGNNPETAAIRNVAGEMLGSMFAVRWALVKGYNKLDIYYDYQGIEAWATKQWKAKNEFTKKYADYMQKQMERIDISFHKVAAHTGNKYNEEADRLAKDALENANGIPEII